MSFWALLTGLPALLKDGLAYLGKREDTKVAQAKVDGNVAIQVAPSLIANDTAGKQAQKELNMIGMNHPIWWVGWTVFVLPVGVYHACIFWVSTFPELGWLIKQVPAKQEEWGQMIVISLFGAQVATGVVKSIAEAVINRR